MAPTVILSPHIDDAVLSCWHVLSSPGEVQVVNVFAGIPADRTEPGWWDRHLGSPEAAVGKRREEDRRALAHAGRSARNLDFIDMQYRNGDQPAEPLRAAVAAAVPRGATVYAPASLGLNDDHDAVRSAAVDLSTNGTRVVLYADLPHASAGGWPPWVVGMGGSERVASAWASVLERSGLAPEPPAVHRLTSREFERKAAAVREYASQMEALEAMFRQRMDDPDLVGYEVEWTLPAAAPGSSSASASARKPAAS
jgi:LmbE family N-acetylglucosaminyl deacetylase